MFSIAGQSLHRPGDRHPVEPPIDLVHLARHALGDDNLLREVLFLFIRQADDQLTRLRATRDESVIRDAAHMLLGSARTVGAGSIAGIAAQLEQEPGLADAELAPLADAIDTARDFIAGLSS